MIVSFTELVEQERTAGRALGAFTCYDLSTAFGVLRAAELEGTPVILLVSHGSFAGRDGQLLVAALRAAAAAAPAAACIQLDHVGDLAAIERALQLGVGAVMADGSRRPYGENAGFVAEAVRVARRFDAAVEAELGHIEGGEDVAAAARAGALTDPDEAVRFLTESGADCLAVSIGNVHGAYAQPPQLDWLRLQAIRARVEIPLSLHGASGLPPDQIATALRHGIAKINVNTELRRRAFAELEGRLAELRAGYRMLELQDGLADAATAVARECLRVFRAGQTASW